MNDFQPVLLRDDTKSKTLQTVNRAQLVISPYNPRRTRAQADIQKLAQRIERNGFEITRALWAYPVNSHYEVFAGGNRLEALKLTSIEDVPVIVHEGFTDFEITGLADQDNENDEYHTPVNITDTWADYKRLADMGWSQKEIALAKGVSQTLVSFRLNCAMFAPSVHDIINRRSISERESIELLKLLTVNNSWLKWETAALEVIEAALKRGGTAKNFADIVAQYNAFIALADEHAAKLTDDWRVKFFAELSRTNARTKPAIDAAYGRIVQAQAEDARRAEAELAAQRNAAEAERMRLEHEAELNRKTQAVLSCLVCGDARAEIHHMPAGTKLVLTDPPYGQSFQSNRRVVSAKADKLANDDAQAFDLLRDVLSVAHERMADDATLFVWSSWRYECEFRQIVTDCGFTIKGSLIWNKPNHGSGDLDGAFAPKHERIIHAVKGIPKLNRRPDDVLAGVNFLGTGHPTEKPVDLLSILIEATTNEGDTVADPFAGGGSTVIAAFESGRKFWACELDADFHAVASSQLYEAIKGANE